MKTKNQTNTRQFEKAIPDLGELVDLDMDQLLRESHREFMELMDQDRKELRRRIANDPNRCHCPVCTVLG